MTTDESAAALLGRFAVYGRFYEHTEKESGVTHALRSHLEIVDHSLPWQDVLRQDADLVAVMMNPGSSRPLAEPDAQGWAPAMPDRTQYQLMKLALRRTQAGQLVRHIRVINLSDLRTPKSATLLAALPTLGEWHSMFAASRAAELLRALGAPGVPVLRAWGLAPQLGALARAAVAATASHPVLGLGDDGLRYRHPLPQRADLQRHWLDDMNTLWQRVTEKAC